MTLCVWGETFLIVTVSTTSWYKFTYK